MTSRSKQAFSNMVWGILLIAFVSLYPCIFMYFSNVDESEPTEMIFPFITYMQLEIVMILIIVGIAIFLKKSLRI